MNRKGKEYEIVKKKTETGKKEKRRKNKMTDFHRHDDGRQYALLKRRST
jgi:hypothetical protein